VRVPVLCYHRVEVPPDGAVYDGNFVEPTLFASHMHMLASLGCAGVTVGALARWQRGEQSLPPRAVAITFDDAYQSVHDFALPILASHGWYGSVYVVSSQLGGTNAWDTGAPRAALMDTPTLRAMAAAGHEIGSHSRRHRRIRGLDDATARDELRGSREELEAALGAPVESFAFPYGSHDAQALANVRAAGYRSSVTLKRWANGRRTNPLRLGRVGVGGPLPAWQLRLKLFKAMLTPSSR
jgi:peptidoglycan/xylan/chitin deacetylase (PgdA/CDA1 family)